LEERRNRLASRPHEIATPRHEVSRLFRIQLQFLIPKLFLLYKINFELP
jgi:hypothetical protein